MGDRSGSHLIMVFSLLPNSGAISREHAASLHSILALSMLMTESANEEQILHFATTSLASLAPSCELAGVYCTETYSWKLGSRRLEHDPLLRSTLERQMKSLGQGGGSLTVATAGWAFAFSLRSIHEGVGFLVVLADVDPNPEEQFLLRVLAQQTGVALTNARMVKRSQDTAAELAASNDALGRSLADLHRTMEIHARLDEVASSGRGRQALAQTLHDLTGFAVAIEDRYGNLRAWAPGEVPESYPKPEPSAREQLLKELAADGRPRRHGDQLVALASPRADVVGTLALIDPEKKAGKFELVAVEHAATVLAMELARLASTAEAELRVRRDLVEELLAGTDDNEAVVQRAQALGLDLERPHRVVIVHGQGRSHTEDHLLHIVKRVARDVGAGQLLVGRGKTVILLTGAELSWETFRQALLSELGGGRCRVAVGSPCQCPADFPRSHREAQLAATLQSNGAAPDVLTWESLGIYGILSSLDDFTSVERFVQAQLGPLMDYDAQKNSNLVETLFHYLESGGNYAATSEALIVHRSTLKYRLQRIREIGQCDLSDPGTRFNLQLATRAWQILKGLGRLS
ncbi:MAG: helix-turn-helix domain-containing protein [Actinomycetota bacterium]